MARPSDTSLDAVARQSGPWSAQINPSALGLTIPLDFTGLSFETSHLAGTLGSDTNLINIFKPLGTTGVLRVGGAASDAANYQTDANIQSLARFVQAMGPGWILVWGANFQKNDPAEAARQVKLLTDILSASRVIVQIGNEPDLYLNGVGISVDDYVPRWTTYYDAITARVPGALFAGPDAASTGARANEFCRQFAIRLGSKCKWLTRHLYGEGVGFAQAANVENIWRSRVADFTAPLLKGYADPASLTCRLTEGGSLNGIANFVVASFLGPSLWLLETSIKLAQAGWGGVNWHGAPLSNPNIPIVNGYSPIRRETDGTYRPLPTYLAMLAFKPLQGGRFVPLTGKLPQENPAWGVVGADGKTRVLALNKDRFRTAQIALTSTGSALTGGLSFLLTGSRWDSPVATFGGASVAPNGTFTPVGIPITATAGVLTIQIPPSSAALVELTP